MQRACRVVVGLLQVSLGFSLVIFVGVHSWLIMTGKTTLEAGEGGCVPARRCWHRFALSAGVPTACRFAPCSSSAYNFGAYRNLCLVLGAEPKWWLWPDQPKEVDDTTRQGTDFRR